MLKELKELKELRENSNQKNIQKIIEKSNILLEHKLKNAKILQPNNNQGVIINIGNGNDNDNSTLHSVPNSNQKRLLISIVPGPENEIKKLKIAHNQFIKLYKLK